MANQDEIRKFYDQAERARTYGEAIEWYMKGVELGDLESMYRIGDIYYYRLQPQQPKEGIEWWRKAAELGHPKSQRMMGWYLTYIAFPRQEDEGRKWYQRAAENGDWQSQKTLGNKCAWDGKYDEAEYWWNLAAEQGVPEAQVKLGTEYFSGDNLKQDFDKAIYWWKKAAEQGDSGAAYNVGLSYFKGDSVAKDYDEAFKWLQQAAVSGDRDAKYLLAQCYEFGYGTKKDMGKATTWYGSAARMGQAAAQRRYEEILIEDQPDEAEKWVEKGRLAYDNGDLSEAYRYFLKAAELGDAFAQYSIGFFFYDGQGVQQDDAKAKYWLEKAAAQGHEHATKLLEDLKAKTQKKSKSQ